MVAKIRLNGTSKVYTRRANTLKTTKKTTDKNYHILVSWQKKSKKMLSSWPPVLVVKLYPSLSSAYNLPAVKTILCLPLTPMRLETS